jgi:exonuclease III
MLTFTADELRALAIDRPPPRAVRKTLFTLQLWRPACRRRAVLNRVTTSPSPAGSGLPAPASCSGRKQQQQRQQPRQSADPVMRFGWLNAQSLRTKPDAIRLSITEKSLDVLALTETWHVSSDDVCLRTATPDDYAREEVARPSGRGGGVAIIFRKHLKCERVPIPPSSTFEAICVRLTANTSQVVVLNVYRSGSERIQTQFFDELATVFETLVVFSCPVIIGGDFNIKVQNADDPGTRRLNDILSSFDMKQHVHDATHRLGSTLDLVVTFADQQIDEVTPEPAGILSDHSLITCCLPLAVGAPSVAERLVRGWRRVNRDELRHTIEISELSRPVPAGADVDQLFAAYDALLRDVADRLAPLHAIRRRPGRPTPWFDAECRAQRRDCRRLERRYRRTGSSHDCRCWVDATRRRFTVYRAKKDEYWRGRLAQCGRSSSTMWRSLSSLLDRRRDNNTAATSHTAEAFAEFFVKKIDDIRSATAGLPPPPVSTITLSSLSSFRPCTPDEVRRIIISSPVKSCTLDPVPTFLVREFADLLLPYVTCMVNASLAQGRLPVSQRHAIVTPLIKKTGLDPSNMANYRPVSNVTFMSKVVERAVALQLHEYLAANDLLPHNQSAYRKKHSTETAMLRVWSDILQAADTKQVTLLGMLDLSAAFDCVDHSLLLKRLETGFGLIDVVLDWLRSFLTDRTQQVAYAGRLSPIQAMLFGVPQGSVLGPLLYVLYTAELSQIVARHGLQLHQYADDCQVYTTTAVAHISIAVDRFKACLVEVENWMRASRLRLNPTKTQVMWLGAKHQIQLVDIEEIDILSARVKVSSTARDLGVIIDSQLSLSDHITAVCRTSYFQLRQLRPVVRSLSTEATKTLVQAFISSRLDYCNSLLYGIPDREIRRLQSVQNAVARLISRTRRSEPITPVLRQLHWLPIRQRIHFKVACLAFLSLNGQAPAYLAEDCRLISDSTARQLRSSDGRKCVVPRTHNHFGDRSFSVSGPKIWNALPSTLRLPDISYTSFKRGLKTVLFQSYFD